MTLALQIAIQVTLTSGFVDNVTCQHDWDCASEKCDNPKAIGDGGWYLTCCDPLGTTYCTIDGGSCCGFGSEFVTCAYVPDRFPETVCGVPETGLPDAGPNPFECYNPSDCILGSGPVQSVYTTSCLETGYYDGGGMGIQLSDFWLPFDGGPLYIQTGSTCSTCLQAGGVTGSIGRSPCVNCCSNNCQDAGGSNTCCSGVGQVCLNDEDCCSASNGAQTESCFLTTSCNPDGGEICNTNGQVGTCAYIDGQVCFSNEQCRSGHCSDAGGVLICIGPC